MLTTIQAIYEKGILRPLSRVSLPEHKRVTLQISAEDEIHSKKIFKSAKKSKSFKFLSHKKEDIYSLKDGKAILKK